MTQSTKYLSKFRFSPKKIKRKFLLAKKQSYLFYREIQSIRSGSKISRLFRFLFEYKRIKTFLGGNLTVLAFALTIINPQDQTIANLFPNEPQVLSAQITELTTKVTVRSPLDKIVITQRYSAFHPGVDFDGVTGDPIYPIIKGIVESVVYDKYGYGNHIIINHGSNLKSLYAHLSKIEVVVGNDVETNKVIGQVGATGRSFGDHLHLEVLENDRRINPLSVVPIN